VFANVLMWARVTISVMNEVGKLAGFVAESQRAFADGRGRPARLRGDIGDGGGEDALRAMTVRAAASIAAWVRRPRSVGTWARRIACSDTVDTSPSPLLENWI
jgi:hypothetical protein